MNTAAHEKKEHADGSDLAAQIAEQCAYSAPYTVYMHIEVLKEYSPELFALLAESENPEAILEEAVLEKAAAEGYRFWDWEEKEMETGGDRFAYTAIMGVCTGD